MIENHYISKLELRLLKRMVEFVYNNINSKIITFDDIQEAENMLFNATDKFEVCSSLDTIHYCFSIILSEVRQIKRQVLTGIFQNKPKLLDEKSVLEKKLDAEPEYADYKQKEEYIWQLLEHVNNIKNNINWLTKEEEKYND